jgi:biotin carboxylase
VHGVLGVDDDTVVLAAVLANALGLPANSVAASLAARDKHIQRQRLSQAGIPVPRFSLHQFRDDLDGIAREARYPCVLKPLRLAASRGVIRADDPAAFVAAARRLRRILSQPDVCGEFWSQTFLVEEFVAGTEVALEGLLVDGTLRTLAVFDKPDPLDGPFFEETIYLTPSSLAAEAQAAVSECAARATRALGLTQGPVHAELRWNEPPPRGGAWLIELAARPIGGRCSAALRFGERGAEASLEEIVIRDALRLPLGSLEREPQASGVMMIPVPGAGVLREVRGVDAARAVAGVEDVVLTAHRGQTLVPWPEGSRYPGFIFARGATPGAVESALRRAHERLEFDLDPPPQD